MLIRGTLSNFQGFLRTDETGLVAKPASGSLFASRMHFGFRAYTADGDRFSRKMLQTRCGVVALRGEWVLSTTAELSEEVESGRTWARTREPGADTVETAVPGDLTIMIVYRAAPSGC